MYISPTRPIVLLTESAWDPSRKGISPNAGVFQPLL